jgi:cyclopropane-fatty-acyl-phospholipid synthase
MQAARQKATRTILDWTERGLVPDAVVRAGIRQLCRQRLEQIQADDPEAAGARLNAFVEAMNGSAVALVPDLPNQQHYELPPAFFDLVLGEHRKYSCCFWGEAVEDLGQAEAAALDLSCARAGIEDGMSVLDLGCGWGSLSLWIAERYPRCQVTAVSNSVAQRQHIEALAAMRRVSNLRVMTCDMNVFHPGAEFDRIVSVEMFEHMRNYREMFRRISSWLAPGGRFFMHIFCHRLCAYEYLDQGPSDWMGRHFFSGGIMPSDALPLRFQEHLSLLRHDRLNGRHYERTANAWLERMDAQRNAILPIMAATYGAYFAEQWFQRWRIFFMACAELFGMEEGREWHVGHYLFERRATEPQP